MQWCNHSSLQPWSPGFRWSSHLNLLSSWNYRCAPPCLTNESFHFLIMSFDVPNFKILMMFTFSNFSFVICTFDIIANKPSVRSFVPIFFSKNFMVLALIVSSLFHFWVNFYIYCKIEIKFHSSSCGYPVVSVSFVEDYSFPIELSWHPVKNQLTIIGRVCFWTHCHFNSIDL